MTTRYKAVFGLALGLWAVAPGFVLPARGAEPGGSVVDIRPSRAADNSGRIREGKVGIMDPRAAVDRQNSGRPLDPAAAVGASRVLPLGTTARVTNPENGRVMIIQVRDVTPRGSDHVLDVSPGVAESLGLTGTASMTVAPLAVPQPDGTIRLGDGTGYSGQAAPPPVSAKPPDWG